MNKYYLINTRNIQSHLSDLNKQNPGRTLGGLDLLMENIQNNLLDILQNKEQMMVEVDYEKKKVTLLGDDLPTKHWKIIFDKEKNNESIYNTFMFAIEYTQKTEGGETLIKEIKPKSSQEKSLAIAP